MKKILSICLAAAAFVGCTNTSVEFDTPDEIGFVVAAGNITRAVVDGTTYPEGLNMMVYSWTDGASAVDYIDCGEFKHKTAVEGTEVWGGVTPYYWPNVKTLHFAGFSKSGSYTSEEYSVANDKITIKGYNPGTGTALGANDLMYFPSTKATQAAGYGKATKFVPVNMYHTCSWITFLVKGDDVTGAATSTYKVTGLTITDVDNTADVVCGPCAAAADVKTAVVWSNNEAANASYVVTLANNLGTLTTTAINVETAAEYVPANGTTGNLVVIPQVPGKLDLSYQYTAPNGTTIITETVENIDLKIDADPDVNKWEPGMHYIYTITIKANEILIAPTPVDWTDSDHNITIE